MAASALCLVALFAVAQGLPQNFFYQTAFHPGYQPVYQPAYQTTYQPVYQRVYHSYNPQLAAIPLAPQGFAQPYIPAVPTVQIYSEPSRLLRGFSYQTHDLSGGHGQVIYVSGPDSKQIFQQNAKALHFGLPAVSPISTSNETANDIPTAFFRAEVLPPHNKLFVGSLPVPLFAYSVQVDKSQSKQNDSTGDSITIPTSSTEETTNPPKEDEDSNSATTLAPSSEGSDSSSASEDKNTETDAESLTNNDDETDTKPEEEENSTQAPDSSTESV